MKFARLLVLAMLCSSSSTAVADFQLTGISEFSTDSSGAFVLTDLWNTVPGDPWYNAYLTAPNSGMAGAFLNSGDAANAGLSISLSSGTYDFYIFADPGADTPYMGINLFFDGGAFAPGISAYAELESTANAPPFSANSSNSTLALNGFATVPGAGTLSTTIDGRLVTLTQYSWSNPDVYHLDRVGRFDNTPNGLNDYVGHITLTVSPLATVPEPTSFAMLGFGLSLTAMLVARFRKPFSGIEIG